MDADEELETMEDGAETEAEQVDEEAETQDVEDFEDDELGADAEETDLEDAYDQFYYAAEGPQGEGEFSAAGDGGLAAADAEEADELEELGEAGFHVVDADEARGTADGEDAAGEDGDAYEEVEIEFDEDDIVSYLVDEDDNEIGFTLLDEDGNEVEYYYVEDADPDAEDGEDNPYDLGITKEGVARATGDMNAIYKDGVAVAAELKGAFDDIKSALDFKSLLKK